MIYLIVRLNFTPRAPDEMSAGWLSKGEILCAVYNHGFGYYIKKSALVQRIFYENKGPLRLEGKNSLVVGRCYRFADARGSFSKLPSLRRRGPASAGVVLSVGIYHAVFAALPLDLRRSSASPSASILPRGSAAAKRGLPVPNGDKYYSPGSASLCERHPV